MHGFEALLGGVESAASQTAILIVSWVLFWVFAVSGVLKLRRPAHVALAMVRFRVVRRVRPNYGRALGIAEILLAIALILPSRPVALIVAALLVWGFAALLASALLRGERFPCACFGDTSEEVSGAGGLLGSSRNGDGLRLEHFTVPVSLIDSGCCRDGSGSGCLGCAYRTTAKTRSVESRLRPVGFAMSPVGLAVIVVGAAWLSVVTLVSVLLVR